MEQREGYAPGWSGDALDMMGRRTAKDRAAFVLPFLPGAVGVLDVGCGPGTITVGLAHAAPASAVTGIDRELSQIVMARAAAEAAGVANARFEQGSAYELPVADRSVDLVFSHAVFEHLAHADRALAEFGRVLRDGGVIALSTSDWNRAQLDPHDDDVDRALRAHYLLRRRAGGEPFMGRDLPDLVRAAGFTDLQVGRADRVDMAYDELARYVGTRAAAAVRDADGEDREVLAEAADAAGRWAMRTGTFVQCWIEVTARWPGAPPPPPTRG